MPRRILRIDAGVASVAREARFESEEQLHRTISEHPEVLPSEDVDVGPLVALANELDLGAGPIDLLAADAHGRLVIVEFKRGTGRRLISERYDYERNVAELIRRQPKQTIRGHDPRWQTPQHPE
jgi:RecB family endonuclease NucS